MKKLASASVLILVVTTLCVPAFAWGGNGHKTVGQIAQIRLANTTALERIRAILRDGETLANISNWADQVKDERKFKSNAIHFDADTQHFYRNAANKFNGDWHFVNLPLGCASYTDCPPVFTEDVDIVDLINVCVRKLRNGNVPNLTKRNALRMLVHLVGDLHQPLHVGSGYINNDGPNDSIVFESNPTVIRQFELSSDVGGNSLLLRGEDTDNLHSFWDTELVEEARRTRSILQFATDLNGMADSNWASPGSFNTWPARWAADSLRASREHAYPTIRIRREVTIDNRTKYLVSKGNSYQSDNRPVVERQLAKAGYRLAELLKAILP